jgi:hypothetical protein
MKNPNSPMNRLKKYLLARWSAEDYSGAQPRFQIQLFAKDLAIFVLLPALTVVFFKACENGMSKPSRRTSMFNKDYRTSGNPNEAKSQIIDFRGGGGGLGFSKHSPGSLVRVQLLNQVETYSNAPVHAQIVDDGLGHGLLGGTLIGDAVSDTNFDRINITFKYVRDPHRVGVALPISARALSLDGTLGLVAEKKESFLTRSAIGSAGSTTQDLQGRGGDSKDFRQVLLKALTAGLFQEFGSETQIENNRAHVLSLNAGVEFFVELSDFFPGSGR